ncbi:hypothetical protein BDK51DRAFT_45643 [Blyttiomyces helicus]|uniref:Uncharacterized protein n=1 Tax=Blyttiomyces helicus TaxID=388810 RepID=A0A4P9W9Z7_9FUNG|nr:hypothetical protein BDK51DRAFT_45643 [Blyttiomyces helicus]|eukprot:RKO89389.1 hypothetical protein BDK51DRAFT_45643 [Blyttiomyces helicus]
MDDAISPVSLVPTHSAPRKPRLPNELIDAILVHLPTSIAVSLHRTAVVRQHMAQGKLRHAIQRALNDLNLPALQFFASLHPKWTQTGDRWDCICDDDTLPDMRPSSNDDDDDEDADDASNPTADVDAEVYMVRCGTRWRPAQPTAVRQPPALVATVRHRLDALQFLVESGFGVARAIDAACRHAAPLPIVVYLHELRREGVATSLAMDYAAHAGNLEVLQFLNGGTEGRGGFFGGDWGSCAPARRARPSFVRILAENAWDGLTGALEEDRSHSTPFPLPGAGSLPSPFANAITQSCCIHYLIRKCASGEVWYRKGRNTGREYQSCHVTFFGGGMGDQARKNSVLSPDPAPTWNRLVVRHGDTGELLLICALDIHLIFGNLSNDELPSFGDSTTNGPKSDPGKRHRGWRTLGT